MWSTPSDTIDQNFWMINFILSMIILSIILLWIRLIFVAAIDYNYTKYRIVGNFGEVFNLVNSVQIAKLKSHQFNCMFTYVWR
jgi:hypothetical protein